jgi:Tfp pilus assembly protein FimT
MGTVGLSSKRPRSLRRRSRAGFTLLELMIIVTITLIIAGLAGPGMMRSFAVARAQRFSYDISRIGRRARAEAIGYGRAYLLVYEPIGRGALALWRGTNDSCRQNPWATITAGGCVDGQLDCVDRVTADSYSTSSHYSVIETGGVRRLCFEPDGDLFVDSGGGLVRAVRTVRIELQRFDIGVSSGAPVERRAVLFPLSSPARVER